MEAPVRLRGGCREAVQRVVPAAVGALLGAGPRPGPLRSAHQSDVLKAIRQQSLRPAYPGSLIRLVRQGINESSFEGFVSVSVSVSVTRRFWMG